MSLLLCPFASSEKRYGNNMETIRKREGKGKVKGKVYYD
jgi:hypothetical protein